MLILQIVERPDKIPAASDPEISRGRDVSRLRFQKWIARSVLHKNPVGGIKDLHQKRFFRAGTDRDLIDRIADHKRLLLHKFDGMLCRSRFLAGLQLYRNFLGPD